MNSLNVLPEFIEQAFTEWSQAAERPVHAGVYQIRPEGSEDIFWSYWDAEFEGGKWGRATRDYTMVQTPAKGGFSPKQDREFRGLLNEPKVVTRERVAGCVMLVKDIDDLLTRGAVICNLELVGDEWHGEYRTSSATYRVTVPVNACTPAFIGDRPVKYSLSTEEVEEDDGEL